LEATSRVQSWDRSSGKQWIGGRVRLVARGLLERECRSNEDDLAVGRAFDDIGAGVDNVAAVDLQGGLVHNGAT
jgi:hypothetical protein